ncbi:MAG: DUF5050 domain-containing protein [Candidatus Eremiobacterota bacterium]
MKNFLYFISFTGILFFFTIVYTYAGTGEGAAEILKEINLLKGKLSSMDIYTETSEKGYLQIEKKYKDGKNIIVKTLFDKNGNVLCCDEYITFQDKLIWEHKETGSVHFIITAGKNGMVKREDVAFAPVSTCTPPPYVPRTVTPTQHVKPSVTPALSISPAPSPTPCVKLKLKEKIIFVSDFDGIMNIYTINPDGSNLYKITKERYEKAFPSISPDGLKIIYSGNKDGTWNIYTVNTDGTGEKRLTNSGSNDIMPCFIDKNNIIFQSFREGKPAIYRMALDTKEVSLLTNDFILSIHPVLYPDRKKILFAGEKNGKTELYSMDIDGKNLKELTHSRFEKSFPSISSDGKKIAFSGNSEGRWSIYIIDGGKQRKINTGFKDSIYPSWTCDGKHIVFQALEKGNTGLFKINLSGEKSVKLTDNKSNNIQARCQFIMVK